MPTPLSVHVTLDAPDRSDSWEAGVSFEAFLASAADLVELWTSVYRRAERLPEAVVERAAALPGEWKLLVLSADWCIDAAPTIPYVARLAEAVPQIELRHLDRDDHLSLMDEHLTNGRARSIPVVILLDGEGRERGWWGPRPSDLQAWFEAEGRAMEPPERYKYIRTWYARDKGQTTLAEILALLESAAGGVA